MPSGFTLIELMIVLAILASLAAIAYPGVVRLYASVRASFEQQDLERQLLALPRQMRLAGHNGILMDPSDSDATPAGDASAGSAKSDSVFGPWQRLQIDLPKGWSMRVPKPIIYHFTGTCDGGEIAFSLPPASLSYVLTAPLCRPLLRSPSVDATQN